MAISKEELLHGKEDYKTYTIQSLGNDVKLRKLTQGELHTAEQKESSAMGIINADQKLQNGQRQVAGETINHLKLDMVKQTKASQEANLYRVARSLSCDNVQFNEKEVADIEGAVFNEILEVVRNINDLTDQDVGEIDTFREK